MSDTKKTLVAISEEGNIRLISFWKRHDAEEQVAELNELAESGLTLSTFSAEILTVDDYADRLVDEVTVGFQLGDTLEMLGYERAAGEWFAPGDKLQESPGMTLTAALKHAQAAGLWSPK